MRVLYLKKAKWPAEWIENAVEIAENCWTKHYKHEDQSTEEVESTSQFGYSVCTPFLVFIHAC
jgi:hypothetical protein